MATTAQPSTTEILPALAELLERRQWVGYNAEKVPQRVTGGNGSSTDPTSWATHAMAASRFGAKLGFILTAEDPYCVIDIDHCVIDGKVSDQAQAVIDRFNTYTELSTNGTGVHIWCRASKPGDRCKGGGIEMYSNKRLIVWTGRHLAGTPTTIEARQEEVEALYREKFPEPPAAARPPSSSRTPLLNDSEILDLARKAENGWKVTSLLAGDISRFDSDESRADQSLISLLAFWTQDRQQLDRLFRGSALYRPKWERVDYRDRTIDKALSGLTDTYDGSTGKILSNGVAHHDTNHDDGDDADVGESHPLTDLRNGERFVSRHGLNVRYCRQWGRWLTWDDHRWGQDGDVEARAKETAIAIWDEAKESNSKELSSWAIRSQSTASIAGMLTMARSEPAVSLAVKDLDTDLWLLNTPSGTIDLRTGTLSPARREDLITKITAAKFDPGAGCPRWERFLSEVFTRADLTPDRDLIEYVGRLVGYSLTGSVQEQMFAILYGTGRNGKGVFTNTLRYMLGDYSWVTPADLLLSKHGDVHPTAVAALWGRRVVVSAETDQGRRLDESLVKNLTGGDPITARRMREDFWEFAPEFKLMLATNYKPEIRGTDEGIWRRIHCIPFLRTIDPGAADASLEATLREEWPGILAWAVRGCLAWQDGGLRPPAAVVEATATYRAENNAVRRFIEECCDVSHPEAIVPAATIYNRYKIWSEGGGEHLMTATAFGAELTNIGYPKDHHRIATIPTVIRRHIQLQEGG